MPAETMELRGDSLYESGSDIAAFIAIYSSPLLMRRFWSDCSLGAINHQDRLCIACRRCSLRLRGDCSGQSDTSGTC
jgi:hypothetical protein